MRSPPPIPRLRRDVALGEVDGRSVFIDHASGARVVLVGEDWQRLWPLLVKSPPGQAELSKQLQLPRLRVQTMVATLLNQHAFLTPRAVANADTMRFHGTWRGHAKPLQLHTYDRLSPREAASLKAVLRQSCMRRKGPLDALLAALSVLETTLVRREAQFGPDEVFATRDAFHIVRPDPVEAPDLLRQRVDTLGVLALELEPRWRDAVHAVLAGVDGRQGPVMPRAAVHAWLSGRGLFRGVDLVRGFGMLFLMQRVSLHGVAPDAPGFRRWLRRHRDPIGLLFMVCARVFVGRGAPPALPTWWRD
jgi:hypothetical protein